MSQWAKQQGEAETWVCNPPLPLTSSITLGKLFLLSALASPPPQLAFLLFLRTVSSSGEGLRFTAAGGVRDTASTLK